MPFKVTLMEQLDQLVGEHATLNPQAYVDIHRELMVRTTSLIGHGKPEARLLAILDLLVIIHMVLHKVWKSFTFTAITLAF